MSSAIYGSFRRFIPTPHWDSFWWASPCAWRATTAHAWVHGACKLFRISVGLLGLLSLANIWFHWNLGIDKFIVRDPTAVMPGSMPPAAALCFYILGCALVLLTAGRSVLCQILSLTVTTITTATLVASIYAWFAPQTLPATSVCPP